MLSAVMLEKPIIEIWILWRVFVPIMLVKKYKKNIGRIDLFKVFNQSLHVSAQAFANWAKKTCVNANSHTI